MKHFSLRKHQIATDNIGAIVLSLSQASVLVNQASAAIMVNPSLGDPVTKLWDQAISKITSARQLLEQVFGEFRSGDNEATEVKDVDQVINDQIMAGYLSSGSEALDTIMVQGIEAAFSQLDILANSATKRLTWARDKFEADSTTSYLGYTVPVGKTFGKMKDYADDLLVIIEATWRDHEGVESFIAADMVPTNTTLTETVAA